VFRDGDTVQLDGVFGRCEVPPELSAGYRGASQPFVAVIGHPYDITHGTRHEANRRELRIALWLALLLEASVLALAFLISRVE
jgi:hypothetical protein